jgi:hypothetical protein
MFVVAGGVDPGSLKFLSRYATTGVSAPGYSPLVAEDFCYFADFPLNFAANVFGVAAVAQSLIAGSSARL